VSQVWKRLLDEERNPVESCPARRVDRAFNDKNMAKDMDVRKIGTAKGLVRAFARFQELRGSPCSLLEGGQHVADL
jgi:hypothetical protein